MSAIQPARHRSPVSPLGRPARTVLVSNRLPLTAQLESGAIRLQPSDGGLASGLRTVHRPAGGLWVGWCGLDRVPPPEQHRLLTNRLRDSGAIPIYLSAEEVAGYYRGYSNGALWPVLHDCLRPPQATSRDWELYLAVNQRYAEVVAQHVRADDQVWIHDYHLMLLPRLLRSRCPGLRIGFFLHTPFPTPASFATLREASELLAGMLGADLIGFHTRDYVRNFASAARLLLGLGAARSEGPDRIRDTRILACPMGIDVSRFTALTRRPAVIAAATRIRAQAGGPLFVGVDRLDYTKGIPERLLAFERLLETMPHLRRSARLVQVAVPSRVDAHGYAETRRAVESLVSRINRRFGEASWSPVDYRYCSVDPESLAALYRAADVMLVTPLCDGMNLVAKEFVACRDDENGVLVLSSRAGAAAELHAAVLTDPDNCDDLLRAFSQAITMQPPERQQRMRRLRLAVESHDIAHWRDSFLSKLRLPERWPGLGARHGSEISNSLLAEALCAF